VRIQKIGYLYASVVSNFIIIHTSVYSVYAALLVNTCKQCLQTVSATYRGIAPESHWGTSVTRFPGI